MKRKYVCECIRQVREGCFSNNPLPSHPHCQQQVSIDPEACSFWPQSNNEVKVGIGYFRKQPYSPARPSLAPADALGPWLLQRGLSLGLSSWHLPAFLSHCIINTHSFARVAAVAHEDVIRHIQLSSQGPSSRDPWSAGRNFGFYTPSLLRCFAMKRVAMRPTILEYHMN